MSTFEIIITLCIFAAFLVVAAHYVATLKAELKHTRERLEKLEAAQNKPLGYNTMQAFDELTAYLIGIEKRCEIARQYANAAKRGNYRAQKEDT